jgi:flavin-dependent thymidylate synthase
MMKVTLKRYTPDALELLVDTKTTRMRGKTAAEMSEAERYEHFKYMLDTIKSPFEFVDYIFHIEGVSKNFTLQLVRTRTGAYQQETSRALEVNVYDSVTPDAFQPVGDSFDANVPQNTLAVLWHDALADIDANYKQLIAAGANLQDARAILPTNMPTAIDAKFNLRTLSDMAKVRLCARTQGEYQQVFRLIREEVLKIHPWADPLLQVACVATGQCAFPRWGGKIIERVPGDERDGRPEQVKHQCPHYRPWMDLSLEKEALRLSFWSADAIAQANPVAKDGRSM